MLQEIEHPRTREIGAFYLLDLEFLRPRDHRTPDKLVEQHNDGDHGGHAPENRLRVAGASGGLQVRAQTGEAKITLAEGKHFAGHEKKPATGHRHHRVPHQSDGGERQLHFSKALPPAEAVDASGFLHFPRNAFQ